VSFSVRLTRQALVDLLRIEALRVELAVEHGDFDLPLCTVDAIRREVQILETNPYTRCRLGRNRLERGLVIPFGVRAAGPCSRSSALAKLRSPRCATSAKATPTDRGRRRRYSSGYGRSSGVSSAIVRYQSQPRPGG
jgi:hypothetical protein